MLKYTKFEKDVSIFPELGFSGILSLVATLMCS